MTEYTYHIHRRPTKRKGVAVYLYVKINRNQERHLIGHDLSEKEANTLALQKCQDIYSNIQLPVRVTQAFTLSDALELYRQVAVLKDVMSIRQRESIAVNNFFPFFGENKPLADLQAEDGLAYLAHRKPKVRKGSLATEWAFLMRLLNLAVDYEKIPRNRLRVIEVPKGESRKRVATLDELEAIQAEAVPELWRFIMVACHVGLRETMLLNIHDTWISPQEDGWWLMLPEPKTKLKRHAPKIPLNRVALSALFPDGLSLPQGRIFSRWGYTANMRRMWGMTLKRAGVTDLHFHDLRHSFGTWLQEVGTDYEVRQVLLGHRMPGTTEQYSHGGKAFDARMRDAVDKMAEKYDLCKISCKSRAKVFKGL